MSIYPRRSLPLSAWPDADRGLWETMLSEGDILDGQGAGADWAPSTRENTRAAYGRWLNWLTSNQHLDPAAVPLDRITPERIRAYVLDLQLSAASSTVSQYVLDLLRFALAADRGRDWQWLRQVQTRLASRTTPAREKATKIRAAKDLFRLGLELMDTAENACRRHSRYASHTQYRDGLIIALLAARPIRLKNLTAIVIGRHLVKADDVYWLRFDANEIKNAKPIDVPLPKELRPCIETYLSTHRPALLAGRSSNRLWISANSNGMPAKSIYYRVTRSTKRAFGASISPHLFRDCAATSIAIEDPHHVRIAMNILGHRSLATTQKYYDQSQMLAAGRTYQSALGNLRDKLRMESWGPYKPPPPVIDKEAS